MRLAKLFAKVPSAPRETGLFRVARRSLEPPQTGQPLDKERGSVCRKACDYMPVTPPPQVGSNNPPPVPVVIDTNVVLDWLWFADGRSLSLAQALQAGQLRWLATPPMRQELELVLDRHPFVQKPLERERVLTSFDKWAVISDVASSAHRLTCTDGDDQKFIDLAVAGPARWLFSRDRAVLRLARRAAAFGVAIVLPEHWPGTTGSAPGT